MAADNQNLVETLNQLHQQLSAAGQLDPEVAVRLRQTMADIQVVLGQGGVGEVESAVDMDNNAEQSGDDAATLTDRLHEAAQHFEESHPTISLTLGRLIDGLGQMGI